MNLPLISKLTLVHMLTQDATIQGLTEWTTGVYKVFKDDAHPMAELPYIIVSHYAGGLDERDRIDSIDALWTVCAHMEGQAQQDAFDNAIYNALNRQEAVVPAPYTDDVGGYHWIINTYPYTDRYQRQNRTFFKIGGIYRVCLTLIGD